MRCPESKILSCPRANQTVCYTINENSWQNAKLPPPMINDDLKEQDDLKRSLDALLTDIEFAYPSDREKISKIFHQLLEMPRVLAKKSIRNIIRNYFIK